jgi:hypothetical protein
VLSRPEEIHRASGEADVVPPAGGGEEAVEEQAPLVGLPAVHRDRDRFPAVGAGGLDVAVDVERGADPERIPGAVRIPPPTGGMDAMGGAYGDTPRMDTDDRPPICETCGVTMVPAALSVTEQHDGEWVCLECEEVDRPE